MTVRLLALALVLSGCAGARHSIDPAAEPGRLAWANGLFSSRPTVVVLTDGTAYDATALRLEPDTTSWVDPATQNLVAIPTWAILEVERRDGRRAVGRAAERGVSVGAVAGAVLGAAVGWTLTRGFGATDSADLVGATVVGGGYGALTGVFYGAVGGAAVGVVSSPTEHFEVAPSARTAGPEPSSSRPGPGLEAAENGAPAPNRAP